jgi:MerR family transcriptional regulator, heat shock protein HspR
MAKRQERTAVYVISVAAELAGVHPQTLRVYERKGLLQPERTSGNTRRYSASDIARLRRIQELTQQGVNLQGTKMILRLEEQMDKMRRELDRMAEHVQTLEADIARDIRRMAAEAQQIVPATYYRTLHQLWSDSRTKQAGEGKPIEMGPAGR